MRLPVQISSSLSRSLHTDLVNYDSKCSTLKNGASRELPDFEAWRRVEKEMEIDKILVRKVSIKPALLGRREGGMCGVLTINLEIWDG